MDKSEEHCAFVYRRRRGRVQHTQMNAMCFVSKSKYTSILPAIILDLLTPTADTPRTSAMAIEMQCPFQIGTLQIGRDMLSN